VRRRARGEPARRLARRALAAAVLALLLLPAGALAACPKTTLGDVEDEVMCPVCGVPLELATDSPQADDERALIQRLIARCKSKQEVKQALVAEFGNRVLATPDNDGFDLAAWLVPALAILAAGCGVGLVAWRWRRTRAAKAAAAAAPGPGSARLDADIERYDL
jgi:cytochrome c-type biogenesis protein CcmH